MTATGKHYAEALFMLARDENSVDEFYDGLVTAKKVFNENPEYLRFLSTPSIPKAERTSALAQAFDGKINKYVLSFLQILCERQNAESFNECFAEYEALREWSKNTAVAVVTTAVALTQDQERSLLSALQKRTGKTVTLKTVIDKELLGGIKVEIDGEILDGSLENNLKRAREVISV